MTIIPFNGRSYTKETLESELSISQLADLYNQIASLVDEPEVKTFRDKPTAVARTWGMLVRTAASAEVNITQEDFNDLQRVSPKPKTERRSTREKRFNFPFTGDIQATKGDTLRTRVIALLDREQGATFPEVVDVVKKFDADRGVAEKNVDRRAYEVVRILHYYLGYGLRQDGPNIFLVKS